MIITKNGISKNIETLKNTNINYEGSDGTPEGEKRSKLQKKIVSEAIKDYEFFVNNLDRGKGHRILDLGCFVGDFPKMMSNADTIITYEPNPELYEFASLFQDLPPTVSVVNKAVTSNGKDVMLSVAASQASATIMKKSAAQQRFTNIKSDKFVDVVNTFKPTIIKCDIEGPEWTFDWEKLNPECKYLCIEIHYKYENYIFEDYDIHTFPQDERWKKIQDMTPYQTVPTGLTARLKNIFSIIHLDQSVVNVFPPDPKHWYKKVDAKVMILER